MTEITVSRRSLLIETPTSISWSMPEVAWEIEMLEPAVVPVETASTTGRTLGSGVGVRVGGTGVFVAVGGTRVLVGVGV